MEKSVSSCQGSRLVVRAGKGWSVTLKLSHKRELCDQIVVYLYRGGGNTDLHVTWGNRTTHSLCQYLPLGFTLYASSLKCIHQKKLYPLCTILAASCESIIISKLKFIFKYLFIGQGEWAREGQSGGEGGGKRENPKQTPCPAQSLTWGSVSQQQGHDLSWYQETDT